jgi:ribosomal protein L37AE/L43A
MTGRSANQSVWKRLGGWLLSHLLGSLLGTFVTAGTVVRAVPQTWHLWNSLPWWLRAAISVAAVAGLLAAWRYQSLRRRDAALVLPNTPSIEWGYKESGHVQHADVVWIVERPAIPFYATYRTEEDEAESYLRAVVYECPQCPRCTVTLSQRRRFWGRGFIWSCPGCDFRIPTPVSWTAAAAQAQAAFRLTWKEGLDKARGET